MGAALHLAHAHQDTPETEHRRGGGGGTGGSAFAEIAARVYGDDRAGHEARELILAVAYGVTMDRDEKGQPWRAAGRALGRTRIGDRRLDQLVAADAPRYVAPRSVTSARGSMAPSCDAPRLRPYRPRGYKPRGPQEPEPVNLLAQRLPEPIVHVPPGYKPPRDWRTEDGVCGADGYHRVIERQLGTGWAIGHWFCRRHEDHAKRVAEQVRAQNEAAPEPIPNQGGLLPSYFDADWEKVYRHYAGERWQVPVYGLRADDWPIPGKQPVPQRARLRLAALDGELLRGEG